MAQQENVIVTGGAGLLGAAIVRLLIEKEDVHPVVMDIASDPKRLETVKSRIDYVEGDVSNPELLNAIFRKFKPTKIYHVAAVLGDTCENKHLLALKVNVEGFIHLLEAALANDISQVLFSSSVTTYGEGLKEGAALDDTILQRPASFYGITKLFGENAGRYYRRKHGLDFRSIHYPAIMGPGLRGAGIVTYTSAMIELPAQGKPYGVPISPEIRLPMVYVEDGARALIMLGKVPSERIKTVNYFINGVRSPVPNAGEMVEIVKRHIPDAQITFDVNADWDQLLKSASHMVDDASAVEEWGWIPVYDTFDKVVEVYLTDLKK
jgi:nucleoside-diphosphate-sugar epimerase